MNSKKHEKVFFNRAEVEDAVVNQESICNEHFERVVFALKDSIGNEFSLSLSTVLDCLYFAVSQNYLPKLPAAWVEEANMCRE